MLITALDFGSAQIKALVTETKKDESLSLLGVFKTPSAGFRKGEIADSEDVVQSLNRLFGEIKQINKAALKNVFVNVNGSNVKFHHSRGIVAVSRADNEIYAEDIERAVKASQAIDLNRNRMILHTITQEFFVDGIGDIRDPLGMVGNRLEVNSLIIDAFNPTVNNLVKSIEVVGGRIGGLIYNPLAAGRALLTKMQKELGAVMIDIGWGTTSMAVFEENKLVQADVFPIGCGNITNDLAIGLKCPVGAAEKIKFSFGRASAKEISSKEKVDLSQMDKDLQSVVSRKFIAEIIEIRMAEIFELVNNELNAINKAGRLPAGAVIAGGGAKMQGLAELAKQELRLPVQLGVPEITGIEAANAEFENQIEDPELAVAVGLTLLANDQSSKSGGWDIGEKFSIRKILKHFIP